MFSVLLSANDGFWSQNLSRKWWRLGREAVKSRTLPFSPAAGLKSTRVGHQGLQLLVLPSQSPSASIRITAKLLQGPLYPHKGTGSWSSKEMRISLPTELVHWLPKLTHIILRDTNTFCQTAPGKLLPHNLQVCAKFYLHLVIIEGEKFHPSCSSG